MAWHVVFPLFPSLLPSFSLSFVPFFLSLLLFFPSPLEGAKMLRCLKKSGILWEHQGETWFNSDSSSVEFSNIPMGLPWRRRERMMWCGPFTAFWGSRDLCSGNREPWVRGTILNWMQANIILWMRNRLFGLLREKKDQSHLPLSVRRTGLASTGVLSGKSAASARERGGQGRFSHRSRTPSPF